MKTALSFLKAGGLVVVVAISVSAARAEDFSVKLKDLAKINSARPMPEYKLDRVLTRAEVPRGDDMPEQTFDVFIRFKEFGDVRLDEAGEAGPSTGKHWAKGMTFRHGLADLAEIKTGWIKDAPDLFIVAWVQEPDGRGNGNDYSHSYVILQLKEHRARVLLRGTCAVNARLRNGVHEGTLDYSSFSFDSKRGLLEERLTRTYETASDRPHDLGCLRKYTDGHDVYVTSIHETITLTYKLADNRLVPGSCGLVYKTQKQDELSAIVRFYLGPLATRSALLEANAKLAAKHKGIRPEAAIYLDEGQEIKVPVPEQWLIENFGHGLAVKQGKD